MTTRRSQGFILAMVLIMLSVVALIMSILTQNTRMLITQTRRQQIAAINRNQILSARAWARTQSGPVTEKVVLDINDLFSRPNELQLLWIDANHVDVQAWARWGSQQGKQEQRLDL